MSGYKLTYFDGRGKAEISRLIFAAAGQDYEDNRISAESWSANKSKILPSLSYGQIPILEVDGITLFQSLAIARYLARKFGLAGKTELEMAQVDAIVDCTEEMTNKIYDMMHENEESVQKELKKKFVQELVPSHMAKLEKLLTGNYYVGDTMTWADLAVLQAIHQHVIMSDKIDYGNYPKVMALKERVAESPKIAAYLAKRPSSSF